MTGHQNDLLGDWIRGLFETEGINDELMSTCKPAEFHLLAATLFDQSIKAYQAGVLALETLKGGLESRKNRDRFARGPETAHVPPPRQSSRVLGTGIVGADTQAGAALGIERHGGRVDEVECAEYECGGDA
ncbi:MAG: hypothetical protein Q9183_006675 [Haloplaca sp. 2 TL-2023]